MREEAQGTVGGKPLVLLVLVYEQEKNLRVLLRKIVNTDAK